MPVPSRKARDGTAATKSPCVAGGRFCSGRPFFGRAAVCSIQYQAESPPGFVIAPGSGIITSIYWEDLAIVKTIHLGLNGPVVSQIGLGCMAMSDMYGPSDESESIATIHAALDAGITMLDTGDFYGMGHNEMLIRRAIEGKRKDIFLAVKFGALRGPDGSFNGYDLRPEAVKNFVAYSLRRLGTDYIDLYQPSRVDARIPIEETYGTLAG